MDLSSSMQGWVAAVQVWMQPSSLQGTELKARSMNDSAGFSLRHPGRCCDCFWSKFWLFKHKQGKGKGHCSGETFCMLFAEHTIEVVYIKQDVSGETGLISRTCGKIFGVYSKEAYSALYSLCVHAIDAAQHSAWIQNLLSWTPRNSSYTLLIKLKIHTHVIFACTTILMWNLIQSLCRSWHFLCPGKCLRWETKVRAATAEQTTPKKTTTTSTHNSHHNKPNLIANTQSVHNVAVLKPSCP